MHVYMWYILRRKLFVGKSTMTVDVGGGEGEQEGEGKRNGALKLFRNFVCPSVLQGTYFKRLSILANVCVGLLWTAVNKMKKKLHLAKLNLKWWVKVLALVQTSFVTN